MTNYFFRKNEIYMFVKLSFFQLFSVFLELIGISLLPTFVLIMTNPNKFHKVINDYFNFDLDFFVNPYFFLLLIFFFFLIKNILLFILFLFQNNQLKKYFIDRAQELYNKYIFASYDYHLKKNPSEILRNLEVEIDNTRSFIISAVTVFKEIIFLFFLIIILLSFSNFEVTFKIFIIFLTFSFLYYFLFKNKLKKFGELSQDNRLKFQKNILQSLYSIKELKILQKEYFFIKNFNDTILNLENFLIKYKMISYLPKLIFEIIAVFIILIITFNYFNSGDINSALPVLSLYVVILLKIIPSFNLLNSSIADLKFSSVSVQLINKEINQVNKYLQNKTYKKKEMKDFLFETLELNNVNFKYEGSLQGVQNINLKVCKNEFIGILGESGAGKSTILNLLLGLLAPSHGKILLNGNDIENFMHEWQSILGYVPQDPYLLDSSIRANICFGVRESMINQNRYLDCLKKAELAEFVNSLEHKDDTVIGDRGVRISGGQKQRIAIARSLYQNHQLLILDEATSALDIEVEKKIFNNLLNMKNNLTVIFISHRDTLKKIVNRSYKILNGKLINNVN